MNDLNYNEFYDMLYYGTDIHFMYKGYKYILNSYIKESVHGINLHKYKILPNGDIEHIECLYDKEMKNNADNISEFVSEPFFDNKSFCEIFNSIDIEWLAYIN